MPMATDAETLYPSFVDSNIKEAGSGPVSRLEPFLPF